jgi:transcriptional regulator with GAF, ATPase, and Fis domain
MQNIYSKDIIGTSEPVKQMLNFAMQVAQTDSTVLILGETGTGKELLASTIHGLSSRKGKPMVRMNCAAFPAALIESELFGREKGAYTGAVTKKIGRFEAADGSTLLLDEIGELPLEVQAKLLRVLQEGQFERLGDHRTIRVDVRVIASTNRNLKKMVADGSFRKDLFYRLNVFPITSPPLRKRIEDIPQLAWSFVSSLGQSMGKKITKIPEETMSQLKAYTWPGNIRELRNAIERAMILSASETLGPVQITSEPSETIVDMSYAGAQRRHLSKALEMTDWQIKGRGGAAELLELNPSTLRSKIKKLGLKRPGAGS